MSRPLGTVEPGARGKLALGAIPVLALVLALAPAPVAPASLRALAAAAAIGGAALLARKRLARTATPQRLTVVARQALAREAGVALVEVDGRAVLVGFGAGGVRLLASRALAPVDEPAPPLPSSGGVSAPEVCP